MGWEQRGRRSYYYRKRRVGLRVVSQYVGASEGAPHIAQMDQAQRDQQQRQRSVHIIRRQMAEAVEQGLSQACNLIDILTGASLLVNGYHQHKGQWRRKQVKQQSEPAVPPAASNEGRALEQVQSRQPMSWDAGADLIAQHLPANKLNLQDQHKLEQALRDNPGLWRIAGDLALQNEIRLVGLVTNQAVTSAALKRGIHEMRESLGQRDASMLERLLIDRIIMCWLNLNWIERTYMVVMSESVALPISNYWEKRLTAAQGRYLRAVETLARVRRLSRSTPLQVNIGGQQINVAGGSSP